MVLGLVASQRHQPGFGLRRNRWLLARSGAVIKRHQRPISQRPLDAALHHDDARPTVVPPQKTMASRDKPKAFARALPGSPARFASAKWPSTARPPHPSSPPRPLDAILP